MKQSGGERLDRLFSPAGINRHDMHIDCPIIAAMTRRTAITIARTIAAQTMSFISARRGRSGVVTSG
jgi:hypothetical protein